MHTHTHTHWDLSAIWTRAYMQFTLNYIYIYIFIRFTSFTKRLWLHLDAGGNPWSIYWYCKRVRTWCRVQCVPEFCPSNNQGCSSLVGGMSFIYHESFCWVHVQVNSSQYPTWALIVQDYLPIQGSEVAAERIFSSSGITSTDWWNQLNPKTFKEIQILKHGYKSNAISAMGETRAQECVEDEENAYWAEWKDHDNIL